ncbi:MAG: MFS transporter [Deltaproteobacteria bacterium]|nr:MFS transporter [Deltaproteobacteria bacterium]
MNDHETSPATGAPDDKRTVLTFWEKFTYSLGETGVSLSPAIIVGWIIYFYTGRLDANEQRIVLVSAGALSFLNFFGRLVDSLADPLVGFYSDKWNFKWGRRIPWVVFGTPFLALFSILLWFPPTGDGLGDIFFRVGVGDFSIPVTTNFFWIALNLAGFWFFYTVVVAPYLSLLPEITPYNWERLKVSEAMAYNDVVGMVIGTIGLGAVLTAFSGGLDLGFFKFSNGYEVGSVMIAVVFSLTFFASVALVREKPFNQSKAVPFHFFQAMKESFQNPSFPHYVVAVSAVRLGVDVIVAIIPFLIVNIVGMSEGAAGGLQGFIVLGSALMFPLVSSLSNKHGKKKMFSLGLFWFAACVLLLTPVLHFPFLGSAIAGVAAIFGRSMSATDIMFAHCCVVMAAIAVPVSTQFVLPRAIYADVIDMDEERTGYRREAMYNGMEGLITKFAAGIAGAIVPLLIEHLGGSPGRPWGVLAAPIFCALSLWGAWWVFKGYPIEK